MNGVARLLRVVIDTNLFVSALIRMGSIPDQVITAWLEHRLWLVTTRALNAEIANVLARPWLGERYTIDSARQRRFVDGLEAAEPVQPLAVLPLQSRDVADNKVLAAALGGHADYLVSGDNDLLALDGDPALGVLRIVTPAAFMERLAAWEREDRELGD
ncbi:MAG TPA: putative toxin-antitoxin system toxin component, PIN family [Dehalococcoidia bacterium]|nr:putative toxin-antitoxin system toxin component, PIN family [Dehalococcoidia bacterium]